MAYEINKSDGSTLTINDGQINVQTSLQLIGRNRADYGAPIAQNFLRMLDNFANEVSPDQAATGTGADPLIGQLWYKPSVKQLSVYTASGPTGWQGLVLVAEAGENTTIASLVSTEILTGSMSVGAGGVNITDGGTLTVDGISTFNNNVDITGNVDVDGNVVISGNLTVDTIVGSSNLVTIQDTLSVDNINITTGASTAYTINDEGIAAVTSGSARAPVGFFGLVNSNTIVANTSIVTPTIQTNALTAEGGTATISGAWTTSNFSFIGGGSLGGAWQVPTGSTLTANGNIVIGTGTIEANYADIAERFTADKVYTPGTLVDIGGVGEVTETVLAYSDNIFGVVADSPAFILNMNHSDPNVAVNLDYMPAITLVGRTPVRVIGAVSKGDRLTSSSIPGVAMSADKTQLTMFNYIGRALEDKTDEAESLIMAAFGAR